MTTVSTGSTTVTATYDALGRMVENNAGGSYSEFIYGPVGGKLAKVNGLTLVNAFVALPSGGEAIYNSSGVLARYRHSDWLGNARLTSTGTQTLYSSSAYASFGEQYAPPNPADSSYTGQDQDTVSSLYDFPARRQSPSQGRWISPDPLGLGAVSPTNPQTWNRYAYVANNPLSFVDPLGLQLIGPVRCDTSGPNTCPGGGIDSGAIYPDMSFSLAVYGWTGHEGAFGPIAWLLYGQDNGPYWDYLNYMMSWARGRTRPNPNYILQRTYDCFAPGDGFRSSNYSLEGPSGVDTSNAVITEH
jgi:RHS repeat-associated protein